MNLKRARLALSLSSVFCLLSSALAQTPLGKVSVSGTQLQDSSGNSIANATIAFCPVSARGGPISYQVNGRGHAIDTCVTTSVSNGVTVGFSGGGGSGAAATAVTNGGGVSVITVTSGGTGYTSPPTVTISGGGGSSATATASLTGTAVSSVTITAAGTGYNAGAYTILVADTALTNPANICFNVTVTDNSSGAQYLGPGYNCYQPAGSGAYVSGGQCTAAGGSGGACNFDLFTPNLAPLALVQTGPAGAAASVAVGTTTTLSSGSSATVSNSGSSSAATLNFGIPQGATGATGGAANIASSSAGQAPIYTGTNTIGPTPAYAASITAPSLASNALPPTSHYNMPAPTLYFSNLQIANCTTTSGMSNATVGIVATTGGTPGTCYINLPNGPLDPTVPFRLVYGVIGPDGTNTTTVKIVSPNNAQSGFAFNFLATAVQAIANYGGAGVFNNDSSSVPNGTAMAVNIIGDGNFLNYSVVPLTVSSSLFGTCATFQGAWNGGLCAGGMGARYANGTYGAVTYGLSQIQITNSSTTNAVTFVYLSQGFIGGPTDMVNQPPGFMFTNVGLQNTPLATSAACGSASPCAGNLVFIPGDYGNPNGVGFIGLEHANGNVSMNSNSYATIAALLNAGFALGDDENNSPGFGANALSSNWGAPAGLFYRKKRTDNVKTLLPNIFQTGYYTNSMGCTTALAEEMAFPTGSSSLGIYCVSGVLDTKASYNQTSPYTSFVSIIEKAYGDLYLNIKAGTGQTPSSSPTYWQHIATSPFAPGEGYLVAPTFSFLGTYASGTAYVPGQIVSVDRTDGSWPTALDPYNPSNAANVGKFVNVPIKLSACATSVSPGDQTINPAQDVAFAAAVGSNVQTLYSTTGSCGHLTADVFNSSDALSFFSANLKVNPPAQLGSTPAVSPNTCTFPAACAGSIAQAIHGAVTNNSTSTFAPAITQTVPIAAWQNVDVECKLIWESSNTGNGANFQLSGFSGSNAFGSAQIYTNVGAVAPFLATGTAASGTLTFTGPTAVTAASTPYPAFISARIFNGATAGNLVLGYEPAPSGFIATIAAGSKCTVSPIQQ